MKINYDGSYWFMTVSKNGEWQFSRVGTSFWKCLRDTMKYYLR